MPLCMDGQMQILTQSFLLLLLLSMTPLLCMILRCQNMQNNVERKHAIHENRLASVKASLSLSTPRRMEFMDKRLSKNFHMRRYHQQVVQENLKILRALEEIHSRSSTAVAVGTDNSATGGGGLTASLSDEGGRGTSTAPVTTNRSKGLMSASTAKTGGSHSRKKLSSLLARKRNVKAALVARENQKMMEVSVIFVHVYPVEKTYLPGWNTYITGKVSDAVTANNMLKQYLRTL